MCMHHNNTCSILVEILCWPDLKPMSASVVVLKLAVATVLAVDSVATMIAIFLSCTQTMQFLLNHADNFA